MKKLLILFTLYIALCTSPCFALSEALEKKLNVREKLNPEETFKQLAALKAGCLKNMQN